MGINRIENCLPPRCDRTDTFSVFIATERVSEAPAVLTWKQKIFRILSNARKTREPAAAEHRQARRDFFLEVSISDQAYAHDEIERLLSDERVIIAHIETQSKALAQELYSALHGKPIRNIPRSVLPSAAKAWAEVAAARFERQKKHLGSFRRVDAYGSEYDGGIDLD